MEFDQITTIGVVGAGQMGAGIAHVAAVAGYSVVLTDISEQMLEKGLKVIGSNLARPIKKITKKMADLSDAVEIEELQQKIKDLEQSNSDVLSRITTSVNLSALAEAQLVVEAATERVDLKFKIFEELSAVTPEETILCSNTSSISITAIAARTNRPDRVMGMHFMNPVPVMKLVELIRGMATSDEVYALVDAVSQRMGKQTVEGRDMPGFIVNRILMPYINEAAQALYEGIGSAEDIDLAMKLGTNVPMGPLKLADYIGLDTCLSIMEVLHSGMADSKYRPSPLLRKYVEAGWLGRKTGRGFHNWKSKTYPPQENKKSFYKQIDGVKYSRKLIDWADESVSGQGDGRISTDEAKELFEFLSADNRYSDLEKKTIKYIRENYNWTDAADSFLRDTIRKWAAQRS